MLIMLRPNSCFLFFPALYLNLYQTYLMIGFLYTNDIQIQQKSFIKGFQVDNSVANEKINKLE